jgi:TetR/AcrR family transcriptional regulator, repressor for neighboring sulfatase
VAVSSGSVNDASADRPVGAAAVREAVLEAAATRFAAEGTDASLRDIADDAGVNLGLIHRHLGNKDDLLRAVLEREVERGLGVIADADDVADALRRMFAGGGRQSRYVRIVAWLLLKDPERFRHQERFPGMQLLRDLPDAGASTGGDTPGGSRADPDRDARLVLAMAALYGWTVFGPQLRASFGVTDDDDDELRRRLEEALVGFVSPPG